MILSTKDFISASGTFLVPSVEATTTTKNSRSSISTALIFLTIPIIASISL